MPSTNKIETGAFDARTVNSYYGLSDENLVNSPLVREIANEVGAKGGQVLDVGCGCGTFFTLLDNRLRYIGIDMTVPKDSVSESSDSRRRLQWADCCDPLPFGADSFDSVVSLWCLEHVAQPRTMLSEVVRVLKPGGGLYLVFPNYDNPLRRCPSFWCDWIGDDSITALRNNFKFTRLAVQVYRRTVYILRQWLKQVVLDFSPVAIFEINQDPAYKHLPWARDRDAIHIVSGRSVIRFLKNEGLCLLKSSNNRWLSRVPLLGGFFRREPEYGLFFTKPGLTS